jgi:hypothetical protein
MGEWVRRSKMVHEFEDGDVAKTIIEMLDMGLRHGSEDPVAKNVVDVSVELEFGLGS